MPSSGSYPTRSSFRCDCCSAQARAVIRFVGLPGHQLPRSCFRCLPAMFAMVDLDAAVDGVEVF